MAGWLTTSSLNRSFLQQVAGGVLDSHDGGPLLPAHEGNQAEGLAPLAVVDYHLIPVALGAQRDLDRPLLDDLQVLADGPVLVQDDLALGMEGHGQALDQLPQQGLLQELEGGDLGQEPDRLVDQHGPAFS